MDMIGEIDFARFQFRGGFLVDYLHCYRALDIWTDQTQLDWHIAAREETYLTSKLGIRLSHTFYSVWYTADM